MKYTGYRRGNKKIFVQPSYSGPTFWRECSGHTSREAAIKHDDKWHKDRCDRIDKVGSKYYRLNRLDATTSNTLKEKMYKK
jgi:hypothetical protein